MNAPSAPDPWETASAQSQWNTTTAQTQQALNQTNQVTPYGSLQYDATGSQTIIGADGKPITVPQYTATTTLSPEQQAIFEQTQQAQGNLAGLASEQSEFMRQYLAEPFSFDNQDAANWAYDLGAQRLDPRFADQEAQLRSTLAAKGIREGSSAWNSEFGRLGQDRNDAYNQLMLTGRGQAFDEAMATRAQPINELSALLSGSQVTNPAASFANTPQTGVGSVDYTGLVNNQYNAQMQQYNSGMNAIGGLFGLGTNMLMRSDRRAKADITRIGQTDAGTPIYRYRYKDGGPFMFGVMAQDIADTQPDAVHVDDDGLMMVDYGMVH